MTIEYEIHRGPKGGTLTKVDQVASLEDLDDLPDPGDYDYAVRPVRVGAGEEGSLTDRITRTVYWAPDFVDAELVTHLDAGRTGVETTISTTNGNVDTWHDGSSAGNDATQSTSGDRPTHGGQTLNGEPVVSFASGESLGLSISQAASYTLGIVFRQQATGTTDILTGDVSIGKSSGSWNAAGVTGGTADADWHVLTLGVSSGAALPRVDGSVAFGKTTNDNSLSTLTLGGADLDVAEFVLTDGIIDERRLEGYLAHEWGLESNLPNLHRFKESQPFKHDPYRHPDPWHSTDISAENFQAEYLDGIDEDPVFFLNPDEGITLIG